MPCQQQPSRSGLTNVSLEFRLMPNVPLDLAVRVSNGFCRCTHTVNLLMEDFRDTSSITMIEGPSVS